MVEGLNMSQKLHKTSFCCLESISPESRLILRRLPLCRSTAPSLRYMGGALLRAALLQGPERAERRAVHAEQRVESVERRTESGELRAKSAEYRAEVRRHRAKRGATERKPGARS